MTIKARTLRQAALVCQLSGFAVLLTLLCRYFSWPWPIALLLTTIWACSLFCGTIAMAACMSRIALTTTGASLPSIEKISAWARLRCWLYECLAVSRVFLVSQPFHESFSEQRPAQAIAAPPILLLHGFACNRAIWISMQRWLAKQGFTAHAITLTPILASIDDYTAAVEHAVQQLRQQYGRPPILICHSMGGLVARAYMRQYGTSQITHAITLGSPHQGTLLAYFGRGENSHQMRPDSSWLQLLQLSETPEQQARLTSLYSWHDTIIWPPNSSALPGIRHLELAGLGHVSLVLHPQVRSALQIELRRLIQPTADTNHTAQTSKAVT